MYCSHSEECLVLAFCWGDGSGGCFGSPTGHGTCANSVQDEVDRSQPRRVLSWIGCSAACLNLDNDSLKYWPMLNELCAINTIMPGARWVDGHPRDNI